MNIAYLPDHLGVEVCVINVWTSRQWVDQPIRSLVSHRHKLTILFYRNDRLVIVKILFRHRNFIVNEENTQRAELLYYTLDNTKAITRRYELMQELRTAIRKIGRAHV